MTTLTRPDWRRLLEARWQRRLAALIRLSVAYHDAADRQARAEALMRQAVEARRALSDTEEALTRLSAGRYGRCEQCGAEIPVSALVAEPEVRYCAACVLEPSALESTGEAVTTWRG
jgi:RNA polymerase-binding transcription factor DksA